MVAEPINSTDKSPHAFSAFLRRLFTLWGVHARLDLLWLTRDLKMCLMWMLADSIGSISTITGIWLLSEKFQGIGVWSRPQIIFLLGYATTVGALVDMFFGYNVAFISRRLGRGQLDHPLIQPQPIWMALLTEGFSPFSASIMLLPALGLMGWSAHRLALSITPGWLILLGISILASVGVVLAFQFLWGSLAFWAPRSAEEISSSTSQLMNQLKSYPLDGLIGLLTGALMTALPVGFVAWYPCRCLLGLETAPLARLLTPAAALVLAAMAAYVFKRGRLHYSQVGSQRYSDQGHRS